MTTSHELELLRQSLRGVPSWEIRCGGLIWYVCGRSALEALERWREIAYVPPGTKLGKVRMRMAYL